MDDPFVVTPTKKRTRAEAAAAPDGQEDRDEEEEAEEEKEVVASLLPRASPTKRQTRSAPTAERGELSYSLVLKLKSRPR